MDCPHLLCYLNRLNRRRITHLRQTLAPYQYVGIMHLVMRYVSKHPGASQDEVREFYALDKTSVCRDARRLEELGHVRRQIDEKNRRQNQLFLTPEGEAFLPVINAAYDTFSQKLVDGLTEEELDTLLALLQKLDANTAEGIGRNTL